MSALKPPEESLGSRHPVGCQVQCSFAERWIKAGAFLSTKEVSIYGSFGTIRQNTTSKRLALVFADLVDYETVLKLFDEKKQVTLDMSPKKLLHIFSCQQLG